MLGHGFGFGMGYLPILGLVGIAIVTVLVALLWPRAGGDADARRILAERFARGEINGHEYRRLLDLLRLGHQSRR
jgi:uncharacterized membrane protein